jgi:hypothetical protein
VFDTDPRNPYREVSWRWSRAVKIATTDTKLSRRKDDLWIKRAAALHQAVIAAVKEEDKYAIAEGDYDVYWAQELYNNRGEESDVRRLMPHSIEARLLARQSYEEIAKTVGMWPGAIEAYEKLFFDVGEKIDCRDYILFAVMGPAIYRGLRARQYDLLWKLLGYMHGPHALDVMITTCVNPTRPSDASAAAAWIVDATRGDMARSAMVAAKTLSIRDDSALFIIEAYVKMCEVERTAGKGGASEAQTNSIKAMMASLAFSVGSAPPPEGIENRKRNAKAIDAYNGTGVELRGDELTAISMGMPGPDIDALRLLQFPPPPDRSVLKKLEQPAEVETVAEPV